MTLRWSEWIVVAYFAYLAGVAVAIPLPARRRWRVLITALSVAVVTLALGWWGESGSRLVARDWVPLAYILIGYWLPASFVEAPNEAFERTLLRLDRRWFGADGQVTFFLDQRRAVLELLEVAYLFCYPMVPIGFLCIYVSGARGEIDRFWICLLVAAFSSYGVLPWLATRPPRVTEHGPVRIQSRTRAVNLYVLGRASIHLNTFPSGHAAASLATALAVAARLPWAGFLLGLIALGISVGSVVGRYHYAADALAGATLALLGFLISRLA
jgi:membrane-associated phospholipid phosphatase